MQFGLVYDEVARKSWQERARSAETDFDVNKARARCQRRDRAAARSVRLRADTVTRFAAQPKSCTTARSPLRLLRGAPRRPHAAGPRAAARAPRPRPLRRRALARSVRAGPAAAGSAATESARAAASAAASRPAPAAAGRATAEFRRARVQCTRVRPRRALCAPQEVQAEAPLSCGASEAAPARRLSRPARALGFFARSLAGGRPHLAVLQEIRTIVRRPGPPRRVAGAATRPRSPTTRRMGAAGWRA